MNPGESAREQARKQREKAERLLRSAEMWEKGAEGEQAVGAALSSLGPNWFVLHDVRWPGRRFANIDHIAIGPSGVFVIDAKNWSGAITVRHGVVRQNGYSREDAVAGCADSGIAVGELIPEHIAKVMPVLCFVGDASVDGAARDVTLCTTSNLAERLLGSPVVMTSDEVHDVAARLRVGTKGPSARKPPPNSRPSGVRTPRPARARSQRTTSHGSRRRKSARGEVISAAITIVIGIVVLNAVTKGHHPPVTPAAAPVTGSSHKHAGVVVYRVTATNIHGTHSISWNQGAVGTVHPATAPKLPFERTVPLAHVANPVYTINANYGGSGTVTCQITVDGVVVATQSARGPYGFVNCAS
jgi:hypothetical protein